MYLLLCLAQKKKKNMATFSKKTKTTKENFFYAIVTKLKFLTL